MEVYSVENDWHNLLLVDGLRVINGAFDLYRSKDGTLKCPWSDKRVYFVMDAPCKGNYNKVLGEVQQILDEMYGGS
jgi:hypothetical protein